MCALFPLPWLWAGCLPLRPLPPAPYSRRNLPGRKFLPPPLARPLALADVEGRLHSLADGKGHNCVVYFFCGCERCQSCARAWGGIQQNGALPSDASGKPPLSLIVFAGDANATRAFAAASGLDAKRNFLLPDADLRVTTDYKAAECPRAFVIDGDGYIRYTNNHADDAPRSAPALVIVSNVVGALRASSFAPVSLAPLAPLKIEAPNPLALTVLEENGVQSPQPSQGRCTFGALDVYAVRSIERAFTLRNDTAKPIVLTRLGSSCGCTSAFVETSPANNTGSAGGAAAKSVARTLLPGDKITVHVSVDASRLRSGAAKKLVWVFAQGSGQPVATLELVGAVRSPVTLSPPVLDFGKVTAGQSAFLPLTLTLDPRMLVSGQPPPLICTNPDIQILPEPAPPTDTNPAPKSASGMVTRIYRVQLAPNAAAGKVSGTISLVQMPAASPVEKARHAVPAALVLGSSVILLGEIAPNAKPAGGQ